MLPFTASNVGKVSFGAIPVADASGDSGPTKASATAAASTTRFGVGLVVMEVPPWEGQTTLAFIAAAGQSGSRKKMTDNLGCDASEAPLSPSPRRATKR